jgi:hypothetical protein
MYIPGTLADHEWGDESGVEVRGELDWQLATDHWLLSTDFGLFPFGLSTSD